MNNKLTNFLKKLDYKYYIGIIIVAVLIVGGAIYILRAPESAEAEWFNDSWYYRQQFDVYNNEVTALTDFQVAISTSTLQLATLSSEGKTNSDFSDLRFTDASGNLLDYWFEDDTDTMYRVYVKFPNLPASATSTLFMYYGNTSASNERDGNTVFDFFDDFNDSSIDTSKWTIYGDTWQETGGYLEVPDSGTAGRSFSWAVTTSYTVADATIETEMTPYDAGSSQGKGIAFRFIDTSNTYIATAEAWGTDYVDIGKRTSGSWTNLDYTSWDIATGVPYHEFVKFSGTSFSNTITNLNTLSSANATSSGDSTHTGSKAVGLVVDRDETSTGAKFDWILVRQYTDTEPTITLTSGAFEELGPAPVGYWSFDEGYGSTAHDRTSNSNDGTITGATWKNEEDCIAGKCLYFDGSDNVVTPGTVIDSNLSEYTVTLWAKGQDFPESGHQMLISDVGGHWWYISVNSGRWFYRSDNGSDNWGSEDPIENKWYFIAIKHTGSNKYLYIDGIEQSVVNGSTIDDSSLSVKIGKYSNSYPLWQGFIDEVKIYPYARTAAQIKADYNAGLAGVSTLRGAAAAMGSQSQRSLSSGLVGYWKMDESSWDGTADEVVDASGNGNHGVAAGGSTTTSTAKFGMAGGFDGTDDYVNCGSIDQSESFSVSTWINRQTIPTQSLESYLYVSNSVLRFSLDDDSGLESVLRWESSDSNYTSYFLSDSNSLNEWIYLTIVYDGVNDILRGYKNGILQYTYNDVDIYEDFGGGVTLGANLANGWYFDGSIDEMRIYNRALSSREVKQLYEYAPGPVGYWDFEENEGTALYDKSGNGNDGTLTNMDENSDWVLGKYGGGLDFDGDDDYIGYGNIFQFDSSFTASVWVKVDSDQASRLGFVGNATWQGGGWFIGVDVDGSPVKFVLNNDNTEYLITGTQDIRDEWTYLSLVFDGSVMSAYVNGKMIDSRNADISVNGNNFLIGRGTQVGWNNYLTGQIDEVKIYNYARTPKQILEDMNGGRPASKSPVVYYNFDEGYGTAINDSGISDNNGVLSSADWTSNGKVGKAVDFSGDISAGTNIDLDSNYVIDLTSATVSFWAKRNVLTTTQDLTNNNGDLRVLYGSGYYKFLDQTISSNNFRFHGERDVNGNYWASITSNVTADTEWHHFLIIADDNIFKLYIDGEYQGTDDDSASSYESDTCTISHIGRGYGSAHASYGSYYDGYLDEMKFFNYPLSEDEIRQEFNQGKAVVMGSERNSSSTWDDGGFGGDAPIAYWNFEEGSGSTVYDKAGDGYDGTITGATYTLGKPGWALDFDGENDDDYVAISNFGSMPDTPYTFEAWIKPTFQSGPVDQSIVGKNRGSSMGYAYGLGLKLQNDYLYGIAANNNTEWRDNLRYDLSSYENQWVHVSFTIGGLSGTQIGQLFVNGSLVNSHEGTASYYSGYPFLIGAGRSSSYEGEFNGQIDEVKVYDYVRTPAQIAFDYNGGKPVGHWPLDDKEGTTVIDISGNNNHGTLTNMDPATDWLDGSSCKFEGCLDFDGSDDVVEISTSLITAESISFWFKTDSSAEQILLAGFLDDYDTATITLRNNYLHVSRSYGVKTVRNDFNDNNWHQAVIVYDGEFKIYIDGQLEELTTSSISARTSERMLTGARYYQSAYSLFFDGSLDDVRAYSYVLSEEQIKEIYNGGVMRFK